jgi:hypothetical protein
MVDWADFRRMRPDLAGAGYDLLYQFGLGLAFLATTRSDGGPRVHPMCPVIDDAGLYGFIVPSPKRADLHRDRRYAMHSFPADDNENALYLTGEAWMIGDAAIRAGLEARFVAERKWNSLPEDFHEQELFEFGIERCLHTTTTKHGDPNPQHSVWRAP